MNVPQPNNRRRRRLRISRVLGRLRNYFLTGLVIVAPAVLTVTILWWFVQWIDGLARPFIPRPYRPDMFFPYRVPGFGLIVGVIFITLVGFLTRNYIGTRLVAIGESMVARMPIVRNLYNGLKQIFETVVSRRAKVFRTVGLIEFPREGLWSLVFVAAEASDAIRDKLGDTIAVYVPTTPNPTSGFLIYVKRSDLIILDMTLEDATKLVVSGGLVAPEQFKKAKKAKPPESEVIPPATV